ncbi:Sialin [Armadillidium vulgare]|nr:Sialin [Armadillidium vulgare]
MTALKRKTKCMMERVTVPWGSIFQSKYFWVLVITHVGYNWGFYIMLTELPTYLDKILHVPLRSNGLLSSMPYLFSWIFSMLYSFIIGKVTSKGYLSILSVRRLSWQLVTGYGPMTCLLVMCFVNCEANLAVFVFVLSGGIKRCNILWFHEFSC